MRRLANVMRRGDAGHGLGRQRVVQRDGERLGRGLGARPAERAGGQGGAAGQDGGDERDEEEEAGGGEATQHAGSGVRR